jgi:hypothetical protein
MNDVWFWFVAWLLFPGSWIITGAVFLFIYNIVFRAITGKEARINQKVVRMSLKNLLRGMRRSK